MLLGSKTTVEPKGRLQRYGHNLSCSHRSCCLEALIWPYFEVAFCTPKVRLKRYGLKAVPSHSSRCSGGLSSTVLWQQPKPSQMASDALHEGFWRIMFREASTVTLSGFFFVFSLPFSPLRFGTYCAHDLSQLFSPSDGCDSKLAREEGLLPSKLGTIFGAPIPP